MSTQDRIQELRQRYVEALKQGPRGLVELVRQQHYESAKATQRVRKAGVRLRVLKNEGEYNWCPYKQRSSAIITCVTSSTNHTHPLCYGCELPGEWTAVKQSYSEADDRTAEQCKPYVSSTYIKGVLTQVMKEHNAWLRADMPNGDVWWFRLWAFGQVELALDVHADHLTVGAWWNPQAEDLPVPQSALSDEEREAKLKAAERSRNGSFKKSSKKEKTKKGE